MTTVFQSKRFSCFVVCQWKKKEDVAQNKKGEKDGLSDIP